MRITGGALRGRILDAPKGRDIRPTSDKVRLAVFNMLNSRDVIDEDTVVIDAFCGTGALGIEALSWGAKHCLFIDNSRESLDLCKKNVAAMGLSDRAGFQFKDSSKIGVKPDGVPPATLVFLDPPYRKGLVLQAFQALKANGWLHQTSHIVLEAESGCAPDLLVPEGFDTLVTKHYGDTQILLVQS